MTYEELKVRLTSVETTLQQLQTTESTKLSTTYIEDSIEQLNIVRENILSKMKIIEEGDETMFVSTKGGDTKAVKMDRKAAMDLKKDPAITGIDTAKGAKIKEAEDKGVAFSTTETKLIAKSVGKALIITLKKLGDEIARIKAHRIEENSFDIFIDYKAEKGVDEFSFYIKEDMLHLVDFSFDKELVEVGVKPSGEAIVNVDVLSNELLKHFKSLSEGGDYDPDQEQKDDEEDHGVGYDDEGRPLGEGEGDDHHYIKVKAHDYKKAMAILDQNVDPTYVKMEVIDNDGAGNVIIYFIFKHESGFDDMYDDSENQDSEFYQEPDEDPQAFVYDVVMDLRANDIELADHSADMDEALDINDPVLMKMRVAKKRNADLKKVDQMHARDRKDQRINGRKRLLIKQLKDKRAEIEREMENDPEIEPTGGPVADRYGDMLNKIDNAIEKAAGRIKPLDYDTAVGKVNEDEGHLVTFGYDLDRIQDVVDHLKSKYKEGQDFELHIGRGDDLPNAVTLKNPDLEGDYDLNDMLNAAQDDQDRYDAYTDYDQRRREEDDYYEDPNYYKEERNMNEIKAAKIQAAHSKVVNIMKDLAKKYKAGDKSVVDQLKTLTITKKKLEKELEKAVAGTHHGQELDEKQLHEYASRDLDEIFGALGYRQGFDEFIEDNPGAVEVLMEWISSISEFRSRLSQEYDKEELERLGFYDFDEDDFNEEIRESLNPEVSKSVDRFIKAMAKRYGYKEQDAVYAIMAALKQRDFDGVNESKYEKEETTQQTIDRLKARIADPNDGGNVPFLTQKIKDLEKSLNEDLSMKIGKVVAIKKYNAVKNQKLPVDVKITDYIKKPGSKDFVEYEHKGKKRKVSIDVFKSILAESKKTLKEFTDNSFKGSEVIDDANKRGPDMFGKQIFADLLPKGVASENDAIEALKAHDKSPIKARMGRYAPMFVHMQYHNLEHEGEKYRMHQKQYYNSNFKDKDPDFNPGVSTITLMKVDENDEGTNLGVILVKTDQYVQDLRNLPGLGKRHMEEATRQDLGMTSSVSKRRAKAELKKTRNDGSKVYGLDKDGKRVEIKNINDVDKFKKFELDADINEAKGGQIMPGDYVKNQHGNIYQRVDGKVGRHDAYVRVTNGKPGKKKTGLHDSFKLTLVNKNELEESGPGFKHDCAAKVVHETYGKGNCIPEKHTLVKEGKKYIVTHYDVLFESGKTVEDIPVSELDIKTTNEHWHKGYKKKKK